MKTKAETSSFFYKLTPQVIIDSLQLQSFEPTGGLWKLNSFENRVFDVELEDTSRIIVKYYRPGRWNIKQIQEEHQFLFDLVDQEIPVCAPLLFNDGSSIKEIEGIFFSAWPKTGGRSLDEFSVSQMNMLGRLLGRIHMTGRKKSAPNRLELNSDNLGRIPFQFIVENGFIPAQLEKRFSNCIEEICQTYETLSSGVPLQRIHGDCHIGNLLFGNEGFFFLDFDDFYMGPVVQDFWMLIGAHDADGKAMLNNLLEGYTMFSDYSDSWTKLIEPLRALRYILYMGWLAKRWEDPAFKEAFPHFGTDEYWQNELADLESQLTVLTKETYSMSNNQSQTTVIEEPELTNKDIFWDWEE